MEGLLAAMAMWPRTYWKLARSCSFLVNEYGFACFVDHRFTLHTRDKLFLAVRFLLLLY